MRLNGKLVRDLGTDDIRALLGTSETRERDWKEALPGGGDDPQRDNVFDIASFANTAGGCIVYGVSERKENERTPGIAADIVGIDLARVDDFKKRLSGKLLNGVEPSLAGMIDISEPIVVDGKTVLVVGVPASLIGPHRVTLDGVNRFYRRSPSDKYQPDVPELRQMFLGRDQWLRDAKQFHHDRLQDQLKGEGLPGLYSGGARVLVHVLPLGRLDASVSLVSVQDKLRNDVHPFTRRLFDRSWRWTASGHLSFRSSDKGIDSYVEVLRNGGSEGYGTEYLYDIEAPRKATVPGMLIEHLSQDIILFVKQGVAVARETLAVDPPFVVLASLVGFKDARIERDDGRGLAGHSFTTKTLTVSYLVESVPDDFGIALKPLLDVVWQAAGLAEVAARVVQLKYR